MRKALLIALTAAPFVAVCAGIVAARMAPVLLHRAAPADTGTDTDSKSDSAAQSGR